MIRWFREGGAGSENPWKFMERFVVPWEEDPSQAHFVRYRIFQTPWFGLYVHRFDNPDMRTFHDHPWNFVSLVVRGGYTEAHAGGKGPNPLFNSGIRTVRRFNFKRATQLHYIRELLRKPTWTVIVVGRRRRVWGFFDENGWTRWDEYVVGRKVV